MTSGKSPHLHVWFPSANHNIHRSICGFILQPVLCSFPGLFSSSFCYPGTSRVLARAPGSLGLNCQSQCLLPGSLSFIHYVIHALLLLQLKRQSVVGTCELVKEQCNTNKHLRNKEKNNSFHMLKTITYYCTLFAVTVCLFVVWSIKSGPWEQSVQHPCWQVFSLFKKKTVNYWWFDLLSFYWKFRRTGN